MNDQYVNELIQTLEQTRIYMANNKVFGYEAGIQILVECFSKHKKTDTQIFFIGNSGSSAIASHMTADFMKNGGMKTYSLYDNAVTTCMGNDYGYEYVFSRPLEFWDRKMTSLSQSPVLVIHKILSMPSIRRMLRKWIQSLSQVLREITNQNN